jgi:hypothetical protein
MRRNRSFSLEDDYLSRDPSTSKRAAYIRRTMEKARDGPSDSIVASSPCHSSIQLLSDTSSILS